jgi:hypothetical protein
MDMKRKEIFLLPSLKSEQVEAAINLSIGSPLIYYRTRPSFVQQVLDEHL